MAKFSVVHKDKKIVELAGKTGKITLAAWAIDCAERAMPYFEKKYPKDPRPREAITVLQTWIKTGIFKMAVIRKASLDSHAAARDVGEDTPARSAARATSQAVATAHVKTHSIAAANYALQAVHRATGSDDAVAKEQEWQYQRLLNLRKKKLALLK